MTARIFVALLVLAAGGCGRDPVTLRFQKLPSGHVFLFEMADHPDLNALRNKERLDDVVAGRKRGLPQLEALVQWASNLFPLGSPYPNYPPWDAGIILREIRGGRTGGFCAQYSLVFGQACQSFGYEVRYFDIAESPTGGSHFLTEVFVPSRNRWVAFDPQFGFWYGTPRGDPLSVLDLHRRVEGHEKESVRRHPGDGLLARERLDLFRHFGFYLRNNFLSFPVRVSYQRIDLGTQMLFEPYRLSWWEDDPENPGLVRGGTVSSDAKDFAFVPVPSPGRVDPCRNLQALESTLGQLAQGEALTLTMPRGVAEAYLQDVLIRDGRFRPLTRK